MQLEKDIKRLAKLHSNITGHVDLRFFFQAGRLMEVKLLRGEQKLDLKKQVKQHFDLS